jgi:hypothetical protein
MNDLDAFLAEQLRADALKALVEARTEAEVAAVVRRFGLPAGEGAESVAGERRQ